MMIIIYNSFVHSLTHAYKKISIKKKKAHGSFVTPLAIVPHFKHHYKSYHSVNLKKMP